MPFRTLLPPRTILFASRRSIHRTPLSSVSPINTTILAPAAPYSDWRGTRPEDAAVERAKKGDTTDPETEGAWKGMKEKAEGYGNDKRKSQATTERDQHQVTKKLEKEHPKAPRPIIGMTDERGEVSAKGVWELG